MPSEESLSPAEPSEASRLGQQLERSVQRAEDVAVERAHELRAQLETRVESGRTRAVEGITRLRDAVRNTREQLRPEDQSIRQLFDFAGQKLERAARYFSDVDGPQLRRDAARLSREHPGVVVGGALLIGLAAGRLLRGITSGPEAERDFAPYAERTGQTGSQPEPYAERSGQAGSQPGTSREEGWS